MKCEYRQLGDVAIQFIDGDRGKNYPSNNEFSNVGYCLFLNAKNVTSDGFSFGEVSFITQKKDAMLRKGKLEKNDVVLTTRGTVGNVAFYGERVLYSNVRINSGMLIIRPDPSVFCPEYVYWLFRSDVIQDQIKRFRSGTAQPQLPISSIKKFEIPLVDIKTQEKIAAILSALDEKIAINREINDNLLAQAKAIKKQWVATNEDGYEMLPLAEVAAINPDTYSPKEAWEYVNYLETSSITDGFIVDVQHIVPSSEKLPSRARRKVAAGDVLFSTVRPNQNHFGIISDPLPNMLASTGFADIRSKSTLVCNELIYLCLTEGDFIEKMQQLAEQSTSTFPSIKPSDLGACQIPCPKDESSEVFTDTLKSLFSLIAANFRENNSLGAMRDALLPKLMSGEIDVSDVRI